MTGIPSINASSPDVGYSRDRTVVDGIDTAAQMHPESVAVISAGKMKRYEDLLRDSISIANRLSSAGITHGDIVAVCRSRDELLPATLLGIWRVGAAYLPLDPEYPVDRLVHMIADADAKAIITDVRHKDLLDSDLPESLTRICDDGTGDLNGLFSDQQPTGLATANDAAYVIFTSGSTGKPKGVAVPHRGVNNLLHALRDAIDFKSQDRTIAIGTLAFDISVMEIFLPLMFGGSVVMVDRTTPRDAHLLAKAIKQNDVTTLFAVPALLQTLVAVLPTRGPLSAAEALGRVKCLSGGEALKDDLAAKLLRSCDQLWNLYGPTETSVCSHLTRITNADQPITVGRCLPNTIDYVVDEAQQPCDVGQSGELLIGGDGVAIGYVNRPQLNDDRFVTRDGKRVFRTGDMVRRGADGSIEHLGRLDGQVKWNGHRVEIGEIESSLTSLETVQQAVVMLREDTPGRPQLVAYVIPSSDASRSQTNLQHALGESLPEYMVPSMVSFVNEFPLTPNGKLDRLAFEAPSHSRDQYGSEYIAPKPGLESELANLWAEVLGLDRVGTTDHFFEFGGTSLLASTMIAKAQGDLNLQCSVADVFDRPTIRGLCGRSPDANSDTLSQDSAAGEPEYDCQDGFAIIGIAARMPGASDVRQFWSNLIGGVESIRFFAPDELDESLDPVLTGDPNYVPARGVMDDATYFDAPFFGITPKSAELLDPQQRVLLELAYTAIQDAGIASTRNASRIGIWAGAYSNSYLTKNILANPDRAREAGDFQIGAHNEKDFIATRIAHQLNFRGPAINVSTACSTSLVAVAEACKSLQVGDCDVALAGGVAVSFPQHSGHLYQTGSIFTPDGHCRPFDADGAGTLFSDGAGLVVLKRLSEAVRDGDRIYSVVLGYGMNNDGGDKASFTAPSITGQADAIAMALQRAKVSARDIAYVEAHGTATPVGDPIEVAALERVYRRSTSDRQFCGIGSVKGNIGHTVAAAGVAGLIKTSLALHHEEIPPTLHYQKANPQIDFEASPFSVVATRQTWPRGDRPRLAAVSAMGVGGTNVHLVLQEAPVVCCRSALGTSFVSLSDLPRSGTRQEFRDASQTPVDQPPGVGLWAERDISRRQDESLDDFRYVSGRQDESLDDFRYVSGSFDVPRADSAHQAKPFPFVVLPLSAKNQTACTEAADQLGKFIETIDRPNWDDITHTLAQCRDHWPHRGVAIAHHDDSCDTVANLSKTLQQTSPQNFIRGKATSIERDIAFLFPGQGAQYVRMGQDLSEHANEFRESMEECCEILLPLLNRDLRDILFPETGDEESAVAILQQTNFTQPALFALGVSLARQWQAWGITPARLIGHSIGEFAAACVAGVFSLADGLALIAARGDLMQSLPTGSMLSVRLPGQEVERLLPRELDLASFNGPELCVVSGPTETVQAFAKQMESRDVVCRPLHTSHAFHSSMMDDIVDPFAEIVSKVKLSAPTIPIQSTVTGQTLTDEQATDPWYWAEHLRKPVRFSDVVSTLWNEAPQTILLELGPRRVLSTLAMQHAADPKTQLAISVLGNQAADHAECHATLSALAKLWCAGIEIDWKKILRSGGRVTSLPEYPFERREYLILPTQNLAPSASCTISPSDKSTMATPEPNRDRVNQIRDAINQVFEDCSGVELSQYDDQTTFFEMGLDSLVLTQTATAINKAFDIEVTFRQLLEDVCNPYQLVTFLDEMLPADRFEVAESVSTAGCAAGKTVQNGSVTAEDHTAPIGKPAPSSPMFAQPIPQQHSAAPVCESGVQALIGQQLQLMSQQLALLSAAPLPTPPMAGAPAAATTGVNESPAEIQMGAKSSEQWKRPEPLAVAKPFGAAARVTLSDDSLSDAQQSALSDLIEQQCRKMPGSKAYAQKHRSYLADPRTVSGFRPSIKEMTFPLVVERSKGVHLWDVDGNQYIDMTCGFGSNFLGHSHPIIVEAIQRQAETDFSIGPQSDLAGPVAEIFRDLTGHERMAFANTGSEAVLGATRLARTFTGNDRIVMFNQDYHGILDEVIVRSSQKNVSFPAATGIPKSHVENTLVLDYGSDAALQVIAEQLDDLAAIVVEPVQSRNPSLQPTAFLKELERMTSNHKAALIFDEVITGFRIAPGGAGQHFDVRADLAAYGKVVGGGMPIGVIAGKADYMNGLDGGHWQFGDESRPTAGMTYFAGTFVRHPITLAASLAIMKHIRDGGQAIYDRLNSLTCSLADRTNKLFDELGVPMQFAHFGSLFKIQFTAEVSYSELLFAGLRRRGIHIWDARPCLMTLAHQSEHVDEFLNALRDCLIELIGLGFMPSSRESSWNGAASHAEARLGKTRDGNPGWFVPDQNCPGQFIQVPQPNP